MAININQKTTESGAILTYVNEKIYVKDNITGLTTPEIKAVKNYLNSIYGKI